MHFYQMITSLSGFVMVSKWFFIDCRDYKNIFYLCSNVLYPVKIFPEFKYGVLHFINNKNNEWQSWFTKNIHTEDAKYTLIGLYSLRLI